MFCLDDSDKAELEILLHELQAERDSKDKTYNVPARPEYRQIYFKAFWEGNCDPAETLTALLRPMLILTDTAVLRSFSGVALLSGKVLKHSYLGVMNKFIQPSMFVESIWLEKPAVCEFLVLEAPVGSRICQAHWSTSCSSSDTVKDFRCLQAPAERVKDGDLFLRRTTMGHFLEQ